jgi:hypothetical protein
MKMTVLQRMEENRIPKRVLCMNLGARLRGRPRNRWQDEVREDGRIVGGEGWQEKVHNREEWKKLLRTAKNCRNHCHRVSTQLQLIIIIIIVIIIYLFILHMPMERMDE